MKLLEQETTFIENNNENVGGSCFFTLLFK